MNDLLLTLKEAMAAFQPPQDAASLPLPDRPDIAYAITRLLASWAGAARFGADQAISLRQVLRQQEGPVRVNGPRPEDPQVLRALEEAGIVWSHSGALQAEPFTPSWLPDFPLCDAPPVPRNKDEKFHGEAYLSSLGYPKWHSPAQKEAAWFTLHAPAGSTRIVVLPTGSGKSLCFQLLPRFTDGLTVVVVPTIALAIDQQMNSRRVFMDFPDVNPLYFAADDDAETTIALVRERRTRLLFTSPEACVSGRLRGILDEFSSTGWFNNLVVDEAHLIEGWGTFFRVEFQFLSAARRKWLENSGGQLRTFLFSATMTPTCRTTLGDMFSELAPCPEFVCQRIRPEIRYFAKSFTTKSERDQATMQALWKLPRPAILYVTEKKEAEKFLAACRDEGMARIASFHGDTKRADRREVLRRWKNHEIDLIIATSAFGVGVDKADVRAVVHACHPENLDRYYQEVGRGGRDGWSSISLLLTHPGDRRTAEAITVKLMRPDTIQQRWVSMIRRGEYIDHLRYKLPVAARRNSLLGGRTYRENIRWNKRLLLQLKRARHLELLELERRQPESPDDDPEEWASVQLKFQPDTLALADLIKDQRDEEAAYFRSGLEKLDELLAGTSCSARLIAGLYGIHAGQRACPGCPRCRRLGGIPLDCQPLAFPEPPSDNGMADSLWVEGIPSYTGVENRARFADMLSRCVTRKGLRQFYCPADHHAAVLACFADAFPRNSTELHRLDPLDGETKISTAATPPLVFLHFGKVDPTAIKLGRGHPSIHLFSGHHETDGRDIAVTENFDRWLFEAWLSATLDNSLPCSPTTK